MQSESELLNALVQDGHAAAKITDDGEIGYQITEQGMELAYAVTAQVLDISVEDFKNSPESVKAILSDIAKAYFAEEG